MMASWLLLYHSCSARVLRTSGLTRLEDDGNVGGVEELDGVGRVLATVASGLDREVDAESLRKRNLIINQAKLGSIRR